MQRDRQLEIVDAPQLLEQQLRLHARVDEHQAQAVALDGVVDLVDGVERGVAGPRHRLVHLQDRDRRLGAALDADEIRHLYVAVAAALRREVGAQLRGVRHRRRQAEGQQARRERTQPRDVERQEIAALGRAQRMQLVEDDGIEVGEEVPAVGVAQEQCELLGRRH